MGRVAATRRVFRTAGRGIPPSINRRIARSPGTLANGSWLRMFEDESALSVNSGCPPVDRPAAGACIVRMTYRLEKQRWFRGLDPESRCTRRVFTKSNARDAGQAGNKILRFPGAREESDLLSWEHRPKCDPFCRGSSSVDRAPRSQRGGRRFDPALLHHFRFERRKEAAWSLASGPMA